MSREDFAWIIVRAFGVYFVYELVFFIVYFGSSSVALAQLYSYAQDGHGPANDAIGMAWYRFAANFVQGLLSGALAYYCLWRGARVHRVLAYGIDGWKGDSSDR